MLARLAFGALLLVGTLASSARPQRVYVVKWGNGVGASLEQRALTEQLDRKLRDELRRRGASVVDQGVQAIVLKPSLEIFPRALKLNLVGVRDQKLLGTTSMKAAGSNREAQLRAVVNQACLEADLF